jgi:hypothetical protein
MIVSFIFKYLNFEYKNLAHKLMGEIEEDDNEKR